MRKTIKKSLLLGVVALTATSYMSFSTDTLGVSAAEPKFEKQLDRKSSAIDGGSLRYALVGSAFEGVLNNMYYTTSSDSTIISMFNPGLIGYDENFKIDDSGLAKLAFNQEEMKVTITIPEGVTWDDGVPLTIDDVIFPYYVVGSPDYTGIRYSDAFSNVVGMEAYHKGETDEISGLNRIDDYTLEISYTSFSSSMLLAGGGISSYVEPKHAFEGIAIADYEDSEVVRSKPIGFGAWKLDKLTPGEAVTFVPNEHYYKGKVSLAGLVVEVVSSETIVSELKAGNYDIASLPTDQYETYKDAKNFSILGEITNTLSYIGFRTGHFNKAGDQIEADTHLVTANRALRQAMAYAIDNQAVAEKFYHGLRIAANSPITPNFTDVYDSDLKGYHYDPEKAMKILAEAGFKDKDGDGFVEDPQGNAFVLDFASMSGGEIAEPLTQYYMEAWKAIGVNVQLYNGRLLEMNSFYDALKSDNQEIDIFQAAIGLGGDPNPSQLWSHDASGFNYTRFVAEENDRLLAEISSEKTFDAAFRVNAYKQWQAYMMEEVPMIPTLYRYELYAVNNRVNQYDITTGSDFDWNQITLNADAPVKE